MRRLFTCLASSLPLPPLRKPRSTLAYPSVQSPHSHTRGRALAPEHLFSFKSLLLPPLTTSQSTPASIHPVLPRANGSLRQGIHSLGSPFPLHSSSSHHTPDNSGLPTRPFIPSSQVLFLFPLPTLQSTPGYYPSFYPSHPPKGERALAPGYLFFASSLPLPSFLILFTNANQLPAFRSPLFRASLQAFITHIIHRYFGCFHTPLHLHRYPSFSFL